MSRINLFTNFLNFLLLSLLLSANAFCSIAQTSDSAPNGSPNESQSVGLDEYPGRSTSDILVIVMAVICGLIIVAGLVGNLLVIFVLSCNTPGMVYETFCVGLAVSDLINLVCTSPITLLQYFYAVWIFGFFWCKMFNFIVQATVFSSTFMLLGLTSSRFLSVVLPWHHFKMSEKKARLFCCAAWVVGIIFALPIMFFQHLAPGSHDNSPQTNASSSEAAGASTDRQQNESMYCRHQFPSQSIQTIHHLFVLLSTYAFPFVYILIVNSLIICRLQRQTIFERTHLEQTRVGNYAINKDGQPESASCRVDEEKKTLSTQWPNSTGAVQVVRQEKENRKRRQRNRATRLIVLVTTLWCVCWLPTHILNAWFNFHEKSFPFVPAMKVAKLTSQTLSFLSSCINPVVYGIMTGTFKRYRYRLLGRQTEAESGPSQIASAITMVQRKY